MMKKLKAMLGLLGNFLISIVQHDIADSAVGHKMKFKYYKVRLEDLPRWLQKMVLKKR